MAGAVVAGVAVAAAHKDEAALAGSEAETVAPETAEAGGEAVAAAAVAGVAVAGVAAAAAHER